MWRVVLACIFVAGLAGCFNLAAATSGQIGCAESDVTISGDSSDMSSRTWIAECKGQRFFCSAFATGKDSGQVNCKQELEKPGSEAARSAPAVPPRESADPSPPPTGAAGFTFGSSVEEASAACTQSAHEWQAVKGDNYSCSGTPTSVGLEAASTVRFCDQKLCAISLTVESNGAWMGTFAKLNQTLSHKYGEPADSKGSLSSDCGTEEEFHACVMKRQLKLVREWKWDSGPRILLKLGPGQAAPQLELLYIRQSKQTPIAEAL